MWVDALWFVWVKKEGQKVDDWKKFCEKFETSKFLERLIPIFSSLPPSVTSSKNVRTLVAKIEKKKNSTKYQHNKFYFKKF